jgi:hypothetical protein
LKHFAGESSGKNDPMLSSAALTSKDASRDSNQADSISNAHAARLQVSPLLILLPYVASSFYFAYFINCSASSMKM